MNVTNPISSSRPDITVLMSVYNDELYVAKAIDSILRQTYKNFELLIINDGSTDKSRDIICSYRDSRIRLVDNVRNLGLTASLNRGLSFASGPLVARFDGNDICHPNRLEDQVNYLNAHPDVAALGTQVREFTREGMAYKPFCVPKPCTEMGLKWYSMFNSVLNHTAVMYRKEIVWDRLGGYDESYVVAQDCELWCRMSTEYKLANLPLVCVDVRINPASITLDSAHPRRHGHVQRMERLFHTQMKKQLSLNSIPFEWPCFFVRLAFGRTSLGCDDAFKCLDIVEAMKERFFECNPGASSCREVQQYIAELQYRISLHLIYHDRRKSLRAYAAAFKTDSSVARMLAPKYFGIFIGGEILRKIVRRARHPVKSQ